MTNSNQDHNADIQWQLIAADETPSTEAKNLILPLKFWLENKSLYQQRPDIAVWLNSDEEPESLNGELEHFAFIALNFPTYKDGRPYSAASVLRRQMAYGGELRAIGDVRRDQLEQMARCGFDQFCLADGTMVPASEVSHFSYHYQAAADKSQPLFATEDLN